MNNEDMIPRVDYERTIRKRISALDKGFTAMLAVLDIELADDPKGLDNIREMVSGVRTAFASRYSFASCVIG